MTFQQVIQALEAYWVRQGCVIEQPYDVEVGAGTMHPATFLRALGPDPWSAAYVQPSRRPADSRFGENPYRLYRHFQYQVMLKPAPAQVQEMYLESLQALGIDPRAHDIRFLEDDWESLALGASGVGWQVWLDGLEITQFTYLQVAGELPLSPVSVEITYGLERMCMVIQQVSHYQEILWSKAVSYGEMFRLAEDAWGRYNFTLADPERLRKQFDLYEQDALCLLDADDIYPAYDCTLKCAHTFNVLDARGASSVTQRTHYISRVRALAARCAQGYVRQQAARQGKQETCKVDLAASE